MAADPRPPSCDLDRIVARAPACLRARDQWVCWRYVRRGDRWTKVPVDPQTGGSADTTDPATWGTFDAAVARCRRSAGLAGVGYVFAADDPYAGVDLDDSLDPATGRLKPWARAFVDALASYVEVSPSFGGVKVFLAGEKPGSRCRKAYADGEVEVYDQDRFFAVTGNVYGDVPLDVAERQAALDRVYATVFGKDSMGEEPPLVTATPVAVANDPPPSFNDDDPAGSVANDDPDVAGSLAPYDPPPSLDEGADGADDADATALTDEQIFEKASGSRTGPKFADLWAGRWQPHFKSQSEADGSLVFTLAFYTKDPTQLDRLFRASGLMRAKWDEARGDSTYGGLTVAAALANVTAQWKPRANGQRQGDGGGGAAGRPRIVISNTQLADLTADALATLAAANDPPAVFVRGGALCRVLPDETGVPRIDAFDRVRMRGRLADVADFFAVAKGKGGGDDGGERPLVAVNPPVPLAENLVTLGSWPDTFPPLVGVAHAPVLRDDGSVCATPGYDPRSRLLYCPAPGLVVPPVPDRPTPKQVRQAVDTLLAVIGDFPFANAASRANALAVLLSVLMRPVIRGHVPMCVVGAPVQGTGKTLLITVLATVAVGRVSGESIPSKQNDDEWRKKITSILMKADPFVLLDNVPDNTTVDAPPLAAALTSHEWSDRLLGRNETARLPSRAVWVATGNNLRITGDMPRRCYTVALDANAERPWERDGFAIADLEQYVEEHRGELLAAAFTVIRGWYAAGKPKAQVPTLGSFQEWADTVGSVLAFAGVEGFLENLDEARAVQDEDAQQWAAFFAVWRATLGRSAVTVDGVLRHLLPAGGDAALPEPLLVHRDKGEGSLKRSLGRHLSRLAGRVFDGHKLASPGEDGHTKVRLWCLAPVGEPNNPANPALSDSNPARNPAEGNEQ